MSDWVRLWFSPSSMQDAGATPDYRFSLANERTFLAWIRTALALVGGGIAVAQFLPPLQVAHVREALAVMLLALGTACALRAFNHWLRCELAMRRKGDLPTTRFPVTMAITIGLGAGALIAIVLVGGLR